MKTKLLYLFLVPTLLLAKSFLISNIPLPETYILDLSPDKCDSECLQNYIDNEEIFSFLAKAPQKLEDETQDRIRVIHISMLNLANHTSSKGLHIAMLLPYKKIGKYASSTMNAVFAYLITKNYPFELKSYKIDSEETEDLEMALESIKDDGFNYVIAPLTKNGVDNIVEIDPELHIYFPTINKKDVNTTSPYFIFGGIDYRAQSDLLIKEAKSPLVIFYDRSKLGRKLALYEEADFRKLEQEKELYSMQNMPQEQPLEIASQNDVKVIKFSIARRTTNLERYLKHNEAIVNGSFFLNTPIVKSGMIMSQLTLYDLNATNLLSTQINYDPLILSMTQYADRKNMIIANSITRNNDVVVETNALIGNDIVYDWINYTTTIGIDYFYSLITSEPRAYDVEMEDNQMIYDIELIKPSYSKFVKYNRVFNDLSQVDEKNTHN